jgi:hypothetical protein
MQPDVQVVRIRDTAIVVQRVHVSGVRRDNGDVSDFQFGVRTGVMLTGKRRMASATPPCSRITAESRVAGSSP